MNFELLYPDRAYHEELPPDPSFSALLAETGLADYLPRDAAGLFTSEPEVIRYRSGLICELSENEKLLTAVDTLAKLSAEFSETASHLRLSSRENPVHLLVESASAYVRFVEEASEAFQNVARVSGAQKEPHPRESRSPSRPEHDHRRQSGRRPETCRGGRCVDKQRTFPVRQRDRQTDAARF